jgi:uncharacterized damage-inducible protein DinB
MDAQTLLAALEFSHARLMGIIETIEKSGQDPRNALAWRPGPGRAHIGWQLMHCAATHDRYLNANLLGGSVKDEALVASYGGGSTPSDQNIPPLATIRDKLASNYANLKAYVAGLSADELANKKTGAPGKQRSLGESIILLTWHEAHHQGQIHLTWNLYKAAHGMG